VLALDGDDIRAIAVAVSNDGKTVAKSTAGPCSPLVMSLNEVAKAVYFGLTDVILSARLSFSSYSWASVSIEGLKGAREKDELFSDLSSVLGSTSKLSVHSAQEAAYAAVFPEGGGIVVSLGTGSSAYAVKDGVEIRAGGWGHTVDNEGGGYWLGAKAIGAIMQSYDGRMPGTSLSQMVLKWVSAGRPDELPEWCKSASVKDIASISTLVLGAARSGDKVATGILKEGARELAKMVWAVWERTDIRVPVEVAFAGQLVKEGPQLIQFIMDELKNLGLEATARVGIYSSLLGAELLALKSSGVSVNQETIKGLESSLESIF
jgi:N-acetylglucosamine kinase-like BadF-type ATPase